mgnify:CR=1 FL=1
MTRCFIAGREEREGKYKSNIYEHDLKTGRTRLIITSFGTLSGSTFSALGRLSICYDDFLEVPLEPPSSSATLNEIDQHLQQKLLPRNLGRKEDLEYLLAAYRCGIIVRNLAKGLAEEKKAEEKNIVIQPHPSPPYRFNLVSALRTNEQANRGQVIIAVHDTLGVLKIALEELMGSGQEECTITPEDGQYWVFRHQQRDRQDVSVHPIRATVQAARLYFSEGAKIYSTQGPDWSVNQIHSLASFFGKSTTDGEFITALEVDPAGNIYAGTNHGRIFRNREEWWRSAADRRPIFKILAGDEGVYFTAKGSPVYYTKGYIEGYTVQSPRTIAAFPFLSQSGFSYTASGFTGDFQVDGKQFIGRTESGLCIQNEENQIGEKSGYSWPLEREQEARCLLIWRDEL